MKQLIQAYDEVISKDDCIHIIAEYEKVRLNAEGLSIIEAAGVYGPSGDGVVDSTFRKTERINFRDPYVVENARDLTELVWDKVYNPILDCVKQYDKAMDGNIYKIGNWTIWQVDMLKYAKGSGFYNRHTDVSGSSMDRILSIIVYLNDVDVGGETIFDWQGETIHPKAGRVALFPSAWCYPHAVTAPKSVDRYVIVMWVTFKSNEVSG